MNCLLLCVFIWFAISVFCMEKKYIHPTDNDQCAILAKPAKRSFVVSKYGVFSVPNTEKHGPEKTLYLDNFYKVTVTERSKKEKKAAVKLWLAKRKFEIKDGIMGKS